MTEEQARTKWCPYASVANLNLARGSRCIASDCMMWRNLYEAEPPSALNDMPVMATYVKVGGFCGLAGRE